jgi:hypothetical protein
VTHTLKSHRSFDSINYLISFEMQLGPTIFVVVTSCARTKGFLRRWKDGRTPRYNMPPSTRTSCAVQTQYLYLYCTSLRYLVLCTLLYSTGMYSTVTVYWSCSISAVCTCTGTGRSTNLVGNCSHQENTNLEACSYKKTDEGHN